MTIEFRTDARETGGVRIATLNRPEKRNALTPDMLDALAQDLRSCDDAGAYLIEGAGPSFCAGFDLSLCRTDERAMAALLETLSRSIRAMRACSVPVVIGAHGAAIAGGCALLSGADLVVTDREAKLGYPVLRLGVSPAVASPMLRLSVGGGHARSRLLDPALIDGVEAERIGLAHECAETPDGARERALELAHAIASKSAGAIKATRDWLTELEDDGLEQTLDDALDVSLRLSGGDEERERLAALWGGSR